MSQARLYARIRATAGIRCGYCRTSAAITGQPLSIEHIIPVAKGGTNTETNLWLSCRRCNEYKGVQTEAIDDLTQTNVALFNPRSQIWSEHFKWSDDGTLIIGLTPHGRVTINVLRLNNEDIIKARLLWVSVGWHPPID